MREAVQWGVSEGLLELPPSDPYGLLAAQMARAMGQEFSTHNGRRYRVNHAVSVTQDGEQATFWGIMGYAPHEHMEKAFAQRREHIIAECLQLHNDVLVYNDMNEGTIPAIQMVLDFTEDVAERDQAA